MAFVARCHLYPPATVMFQHGTDRWHLSGLDKGQTAQSIDRFVDFGKPRIDPAGNFIQFHARIGVPHAFPN